MVRKAQPAKLSSSVGGGAFIDNQRRPRKRQAQNANSDDDGASIKMIPERTLVKISATFTVALVAILVFNNLEPSEPTHTINVHLCELQTRRPEPIQNKVLAYNNKTLVNLVAHLEFVAVREVGRPRLAATATSLSRKQSEHDAILGDRKLNDADYHDYDDYDESDYEELRFSNEWEEEEGEEEEEGDYRGVTRRYLPLKLFFVHHNIIDNDNQELYLICMCAAFKLRLRRLHDNTWSTRGLPQEASTYMKSRKQEYRDFRLNLELDQERRFHCDRPWRVPIENLAPAYADPLVRPYEHISLHIEQLDLEFNGGKAISEKVFTKPIQECPAGATQHSRLPD